MSGRTRRDLQQVLDDVRDEASGEPSPYRADVATVPVDSFAAATCTVDGDVEAVGDVRASFALQSISKAFSYAIALHQCGLPAVLDRVGVEPSGEAFDDLSLRSGGRPFNPLINAGAITVHGMIPGRDEQERMELIRARFSDLAGRELIMDEDVYHAEMARADRNLSIAHLLASHGVLTDEPHEIVRGYSMQCSIAVTVTDLAVMGATLAAGGRHPLTGEQVLDEDVVRQTLSVMLTCGMYDASGEWVAEVGLPAKSGISGGLVASVPGVLGLAGFSPRLDEHGHSVRGLALFEQLSAEWDLHLLRHQVPQQRRGEEG